MATPMVLTSTEVSTVEAPADAPDPRVLGIHIVSPSTPNPSLVDGVPQ